MAVTTPDVLLVPWAKQWFSENRNQLVEHIATRHPSLEPGRTEAMVDHLWDRLVGWLMKQHGCTREQAEYWQALGLRFMTKIDPAGSVPTQDEDYGWHSLIFHTIEYDAVCAVLTGGGSIHHLPNDVPGWFDTSAVAGDCHGRPCEVHRCRTL